MTTTIFKVKKQKYAGIAWFLPEGFSSLSWVSLFFLVFPLTAQVSKRKRKDGKESDEAKAHGSPSSMPSWQLVIRDNGGGEETGKKKDRRLRTAVTRSFGASFFSIALLYSCFYVKVSHSLALSADTRSVPILTRAHTHTLDRPKPSIEQRVWSWLPFLMHCHTKLRFSLGGWGDMLMPAVVLCSFGGAEYLFFSTHHGMWDGGYSTLVDKLFQFALYFLLSAKNARAKRNKQLISRRTLWYDHVVL